MKSELELEIEELNMLNTTFKYFIGEKKVKFIPGRRSALSKYHNSVGKAFYRLDDLIFVPQDQVEDGYSFTCEFKEIKILGDWNDKK